MEGFESKILEHTKLLNIFVSYSTINRYRFTSHSFKVKSFTAKQFTLISI